MTDSIQYTRLPYAAVMNALHAGPICEGDPLWHDMNKHYQNIVKDCYAYGWDLLGSAQERYFALRQASYEPTDPAYKSPRINHRSYLGPATTFLGIYLRQQYEYQSMIRDPDEAILITTEEMTAWIIDYLIIDKETSEKVITRLVHRSLKPLLDLGLLKPSPVDPNDYVIRPPIRSLFGAEHITKLNNIIKEQILNG